MAKIKGIFPYYKLTMQGKAAPAGTNTLEALDKLTAKKILIKKTAEKSKN